MTEGEAKETKERIIKAAMKVFANYGYFRAPVQMIAKEAGISKGLVFWYFGSKDELIKEVGRRGLPLDVMESCLDEGFEGRDLLRKLAERYIEKYSNKDMRSLLLQTLALEEEYPEIRERIREMCDDLTRRVAEKAFGSSNERTFTLVRIFLGGLMCYVLRPQSVPRERYIEVLLDSVMSIDSK